MTQATPGELAGALETLVNDPLYYGVFTQPARNAAAALRNSEGLMSALVKLINLSDHPYFPPTSDLPAWDGAIEQARAAIAKARGE